MISLPVPAVVPICTNGSGTCSQWGAAWYRESPGIWLRANTAAILLQSMADPPPIPMIKPAIMSVLTLGFVYTFKVFDLVWVMTKGGPVNATELVSTYAYKLSFDQFQFSKGAAAANILFLILFVVGIFYIKLINDEDEVM